MAVSAQPNLQLASLRGQDKIKYLLSHSLATRLIPYHKLNKKTSVEFLIQSPDFIPVTWDNH